MRISIFGATVLQSNCIDREFNTVKSIGTVIGTVNQYKLSCEQEKPLHA